MTERFTRLDGVHNGDYLRFPACDDIDPQIIFIKAGVDADLPSLGDVNTRVVVNLRDGHVMTVSKNVLVELLDDVVIKAVPRTPANIVFYPDPEESEA